MHYSVVGLKIYTLRCNVISVKTVLFLPQFHALTSFLVRHVHVDISDISSIFTRYSSLIYSEPTAHVHLTRFV